MRNPWRPYAYQGAGRKSAYFEGWYFKLIDRERRTVLGIIPGISLGRGPRDAHSFIQVIDARRGETAYHRFPAEAFEADRRRFSVRVGASRFSDGGIALDVGEGTQRLRGELTFTGVVRYPRSPWSPGIMGPYSFLPMECYHDAISLSHGIEGALELGGRPLPFGGGEGYIEKDWGRSFPSAWIWLQANHFGGEGASFLLSVARIPWLGSKFTGLICFLRAGGRFYRFSTYDGARIRALRVEDGALAAELSRGRQMLRVTATHALAGTLRAPKNGLMDRTLEESITAETHVTLEDARGGVLFDGVSQNCGMELSDHLEEILGEFSK